MDDGFGPFEGRGGLVVGIDEAIDGLTHLLRRGETGAAQSPALEDAEPALDLMEPGTVGGRVVEVDQGMALEPAVALGLMRVEVVEHNRDLPVRVLRDDLVEEVEEVEKLAPPPPVVARLHLSGDAVERGEQRGGAVPFIALAEAVHGSSLWQPDPSLSAFERLNRMLFVDRQHQRLFGRTEIKSHHVGGLGCKLRVGADAPTAPPLQTDAVFAQHAPDFIVADLRQSAGKQPAGPGGMAFGRRLVQPGKFSYGTAFNQNVPLVKNVGKQGPGTPQVGLVSFNGMDPNIRESYNFAFNLGCVI